MEPKQHTKSTGSCMRLCLKCSIESSACIRSSQGKVYIVTGANTGIGYAAAKALAAKNARVYMASRNRDKQQRSADQINSHKATCTQLCIALSSSTYCSDSRCLALFTCVALTQYHLLGLARTSSVSFHMLKWTGSSVIWATSGTCHAATAEL